MFSPEARQSVRWQAWSDKETIFPSRHPPGRGLLWARRLVAIQAHASTGSEANAVVRVGRRPTGNLRFSTFPLRVLSGPALAPCGVGQWCASSHAVRARISADPNKQRISDLSALGPKQTWLLHRRCPLSGVKRTRHSANLFAKPECNSESGRQFAHNCLLASIMMQAILTIMIAQARMYHIAG
jgi:hypothetical protein